MRAYKSFSTLLYSLLLFTTVVRCLVAYMVELGNDEVYYFTYAVQPDWNHFDHPPLVGLFIRLFTLNLHWINDVSVRLPAIIGAATSTWLIAHCGRLIKNERTGLIAAVIYSSSLYTSLIAGLFILPDSVQLPFWLAGLYLMLQIATAPDSEKLNRRMVEVGVLTGLAILCKVHGVFLWFGFIGYVVFHERSLLKNPYLYISLGVPLLMASPIVLWNVANHFVSWQFHSERVVANQGIDFKSFMTTSLGQVAYNNPIILYVHYRVIGATLRRVPFVNRPALKLVCWTGLPIILATSFVSLFRTTLPHWSGPGFVGLLLLAAAYLDFKLSQGAFAYATQLLRASVILIATVVVLGVGLIQYFPGTLNHTSEPRTGAGDFTLDMYGWQSFQSAFSKLHREDIRSGRMTADAPLLVHKWFPGGHLFYYVAYPLKLRLVGAGELKDLHKFSWLNRLYGSVQPGSDAYFITPSNYFSNPTTLYGNDFQQIDEPTIVVQYRNGKIARYFYVYRLRNARRVVGEQITRK